MTVAWNPLLTARKQLTLPWVHFIRYGRTFTSETVTFLLTCVSSTGTYGRPHVEFATPTCSPWLQGDIDKIEAVQRKAVKMISGLGDLTFEERCKEVGLESLESLEER